MRVSRETSSWLSLGDHNILRLGAKDLNLNLGGKEELLLAHLNLVRKWNPKIRLIGPARPGEQVVLHLLDSLASLPFIPASATRHLDVGSGAGFPGIPLNLILDSLETFLAEKIEKKSIFLKECVRALGMKRLTVLRREVDASFSVDQQSFHLITFRALGKIQTLVPLLAPLLSDHGWIMAYKGPGVEEELSDSSGILKTLGLGLVFRADFFLPFVHRPRSIIALGRV